MEKYLVIIWEQTAAQGITKKIADVDAGRAFQIMEEIASGGSEITRVEIYEIGERVVKYSKADVKNNR